MEYLEEFQKGLIKSAFEEKFDRIYVISLIEYEERREQLKEELARVGIGSCRNIEWFYDVKSPYDEDMFEDMSGIFNPTGVKKLTFNHYKIMKTALKLGYKRILIIEDDVRFLKDLGRIHEMISAYPDGADICLLDKFVGTKFSECPEFLEESLMHHPGDFSYYYEGDLYGLGSTACYGLTANGMDYLTRQIEVLYANPAILKQYPGKLSDEKGEPHKYNFMNSDFYINTYLKGFCWMDITGNLEEASDKLYPYKPETPVKFACSLYNMCVQTSSIEPLYNTIVHYHFLDERDYNLNYKIMF